MEKETTFENAKVGDRVYSMMHVSVSPQDKTNGYVSAKDDHGIRFCPDTDNTENYWYRINGEYECGMLERNKKQGLEINKKAQILFWSKPDFVVPVRPKRIVKRTGFIGIDEKNKAMGNVAWTTHMYPKKESILEIGSCSGRNFIIREIEYETEE